MALPKTQTELANTALPFEQARTPPGWIFSDPGLYAREMTEMFGKMWLCVGHQSRLSQVGDFFLVDVGTESVIVALDNAGRQHAFFNVCRHRGTRLLNEAEGNCRRIKCPYHAWNYALDGSLQAAPFMDETPGFDKQDYPLLEARLESWMGFLFINLDAEAKPISDTFGDFRDLSHYDLPNLVRAGHHNYLARSNWKLICENYHECYHCAGAHPQLHRVSDYADLPDGIHCGRNYTGGPMAIKAPFNTMTTKGITKRKPFPGLPEHEHRLINYYHLFPNFLLSLAPDYVLTHYLRPRGPDEVYIESEWFFSKEQMAEADFDPADAIEFWDTTNKQDWALCENAHQGLRSKAHAPGRYQAAESCTHQFDQWYVNTMFGK